MMKKKLLCTALVLGVGLFLLGGCSSSATNSGTPDSSQPEAPPAASSAPDERNATLILQVQSIEGDKVTGLAGTLSELAMEQRPQNRPDMPSAPDSGQRGNRQPADGDGPPPDGNERRSFSPQQFAAGTETITFAIDAATVSPLKRCRTARRAPAATL
ncbi:hypothetical protein DesLBE_0232 [Desulfitobacterium sp. LBE]|uniref:hypothetical protein n=1 Tax=Desulfitobacterium sp. LBE TaxID=884086 RepID=UPI00119923AB|nr:hypothetical protein [Desulfitobacterium sp. LBE]TWH56045.1 hypothetical protein DesLBE_0232 [Desulfitobacterium sp. LBE]